MDFTSIVSNLILKATVAVTGTAPKKFEVKNVCNPNTAVPADQVPQGYSASEYRICETTTDDNSKILSLFTDEVLPDGTTGERTVISLRDYLISKKGFSVVDHEYAHRLGELTWGDVARMFYPNLSDEDIAKVAEVMVRDNKGAARPIDTLSEEDSDDYWWYRHTADRWWAPKIGSIPSMAIRLPSTSEVIDKCSVALSSGVSTSEAIEQLETAIKLLDEKITLVNETTIDTSNPKYNKDLIAIYTYYVNSLKKEIYGPQSALDEARAKGREVVLTETKAIDFAVEVREDAENLLRDIREAVAKGCVEMGDIPNRVATALERVPFATEHLTYGPKAEPAPAVTRKPGGRRPSGRKPSGKKPAGSSQTAKPKPKPSGKRPGGIQSGF